MLIDRVLTGIISDLHKGISMALVCKLLNVIAAADNANVFSHLDMLSLNFFFCDNRTCWHSDDLIDFSTLKGLTG